MWTNHSFEISKELIGADKFETLIRKKREVTPTCVQNVLGRSALSLASHRAIKHVRGKKQKISPILKRYNAVGAVGYAYVFDGNILSICDFFKSHRCFKIRFRASNVNCEDDAASCVREAAIKFSDQDRDGLLDLLLYTGRTFIARDSRDFLDLLNIEGNEKEIYQLCRNNPYTFRSLADGFRRAPTSFADLTYYSQICYLFSVSKKEKVAVKFRLIPSYRSEDYKLNDKVTEAQQIVENGMQSLGEQRELWKKSRKEDQEKKDTEDTKDTKDMDYLRQELKERLWKDEPISFILQVQMKSFNGDSYFDVCNPQLIWDETECPWSRLMVIELTTHMTSAAIRCTTFNVADSPKGLSFPEALGPQDPFSLQKLMMSVYTEMERKGVTQICNPVKGPKAEGVKKKHYIITVCTEPLKESKQVPYVETYITLWGSRCRSCTLSLNLDNKLNYRIREKNFRISQHRVSCESVGSLINIIVEVYYRHLTESWYLRDVEVFDEAMGELWTFPCYEVVEGSLTLEPGGVRLVHKQQSEVSKKERLFQLNNQQLEYLWHMEKKFPSESGMRRLRMPGQIRNPEQVEKLPNRHRTRAVKYTGISWEVDPRLIDFFREFTSSVVMHGSSYMKRLNAKMEKSKAGRSTANKGIKPHLGGFHETDGHPSSSNRTRSALSRGMSHDLHSFTGKTGMFYKNLIRNNLIKNTNLYKNNLVDAGSRKKANSFKRFKSPSLSAADSEYAGVSLDEVEMVDGLLFNRVKSELESKLPEGTAGEICWAVLNDLDFGRLFLIGSNPTVIKKCRELPTKFPVKNVMVSLLLERSGNLEEEMKAGHVYITDYEILSGLPTIHHEGDHRFIAAPIVLLYVNESGDLTPLAIQLEQVPSSDNPIWTPMSKPESWLLAKLWVRCCDFNHQFAISHLFNCHLLMEPFLIATMRCLPDRHPVYKILMPHFRYLLVSNTLLRHQVLSENGAVDRHTSLGRQGFQKLMERHWQKFSFEQLNPIKDIKKRDVADKNLLPGYLYRDDAQRLFKCILRCCTNLINLHYHDREDYDFDTELKTWLLELTDFGFPGRLMSCPYSSSLQLNPSAPPLTPTEQAFAFESSSIDAFQPSALPLPPYERSALGKYGNKMGHLYPGESHDSSQHINEQLDDYDYGDGDDDGDDDETIDDLGTKAAQAGPSGKHGPSIIGPSSVVATAERKKYKKVKALEMLKVSDKGGLAEMLATIIFTITCQHSATHSDAMDLFGFVPDIPAMMRKSPAAGNLMNVNADVLTQTLPDQFSEAYYTSLLFIMNAYKPDQNILGELDEVYFVDDGSWTILKKMRKGMRELTMEHRARNLNCGIKYECLVPQFIPASPEPLPYVPRDVLAKVLQHLGPTMTINTFLEQTALGTVSPFVLDECMAFHEALGGRSSRGLLDDHHHDGSFLTNRNQKPKRVRMVRDFDAEDSGVVGSRSNPIEEDVFGDPSTSAATATTSTTHSRTTTATTAEDRRKEFLKRARVMSSGY